MRNHPLRRDDLVLFRETSFLVRRPIAKKFQRYMLPQILTVRRLAVGLLWVRWCTSDYHNIMAFEDDGDDGCKMGVANLLSSCRYWNKLELLFTTEEKGTFCQWRGETLVVKEFCFVGTQVAISASYQPPPLEARYLCMMTCNRERKNRSDKLGAMVLNAYPLYNSFSAPRGVPFPNLGVGAAAAWVTGISAFLVGSTCVLE